MNTRALVKRCQAHSISEDKIEQAGEASNHKSALTALIIAKVCLPLLQHGNTTHLWKSLATSAWEAQRREEDRRDNNPLLKSIFPAGVPRPEGERKLHSMPGPTCSQCLQRGRDRFFAKLEAMEETERGELLRDEKEGARARWLSCRQCSCGKQKRDDDHYAGLAQAVRTAPSLPGDAQSYPHAFPLRSFSCLAVCMSRCQPHTAS